MTRLRVASLNLSGAQGKGEWARFVSRCGKWVRQEGMDVILGQEHNLEPGRERELKAVTQMGPPLPSGTRPPSMTPTETSSHAPSELRDML